MRHALDIRGLPADSRTKVAAQIARTVRIGLGLKHQPLNSVGLELLGEIGEAGQCTGIIDAQVCTHILACNIQELGCGTDLADNALALDLVKHCLQHLLLALRAAKIVVGMAGTGIAQGGCSVHPLQASRNIQPHVAVILGGILGIQDGSRHVDRHAAKRINDLLKAVEVDLRGVRNFYAKELFHRLSR